ncbi:hypothetical protein [Aurantiacibacter suaedae]|uniref:hypothetical protein n=1 Tax=Aurantiacibacter suaedae TaxID=2545755 RepID=UPI0010F5DD14|nr:hypothetical protein [Aurantiacibacter suaedae]
MSEERTTITTDEAGNTHSHTTTYVRDDAPRSSSSGVWVIAVLVLAALLIGGLFLTQMSNAEVAKDNAVAEAANSVSGAADQVGDTVKQVGDSVTNE